MSEELKYKKNENFSEWYTEVIIKAGLADYAPVKGCMIFLPYGFAIWNNIKKEFSKFLADVKEVYFPLFIPKSILEKESEHFEGFTPEVAWVTKGGERDLDEWLAVRPTSETIMYEYFSKIVKSWRDLPLKIVQWVNVVRWETKATKLFLRTREFLWHEGHTCHSSEKEARDEVLKRIRQYKKFVEEYLAIPVIAGFKSEKEKFAGAVFTTTIEALMPDGRALQCGTSHYLGQNFSKVFNIKFQDKDEKLKYVHQTSWGFSTRLLGAIVMVHGDDRGLIIPPKIAPIQVIIIPIYYNEEEYKKVVEKAKEIKEILEKENIKCEIDERKEYTPGYKFYEWELKGVPLRIEVGPKDLEKKSCVICRRDNFEKIKIDESKIIKKVRELLESIQKSLFERAKKFLDSHTKQTENYEEFKKLIDERFGFVIANFCGSIECEEKIKEETGATIRVIEFEDSKPFGSKKCIYCNKEAKYKVYFAKAY